MNAGEMMFGFEMIYKIWWGHVIHVHLLSLQVTLL
jgi:hypothetical protein